MYSYLLEQVSLRKTISLSGGWFRQTAKHFPINQANADPWLKFSNPSIYYQYANLLPIQPQSITNTSGICVNRKGTSILYGSLISLIGGWFNQIIFKPIQCQYNANASGQLYSYLFGTSLWGKATSLDGGGFHSDPNHRPSSITDNICQSTANPLIHDHPANRPILAHPMPIHTQYIWPLYSYTGNKNSTGTHHWSRRRMISLLSQKHQF